MHTPTTTGNHRPIRQLGLAVLALLALGGAHCPPALAQPQGEVSRLRVLLVVDTLGDSKGHIGFQKDEKRLLDVLTAALKQQHLGGRCTLEVLKGAEATPRRVLDYYRNLKTDSSEGLLCYYVGHGATHSTWGHVLTMTNGPLYRSDLRRAMARHKPRLLVLLSISCASTLGLDTGRQAGPAVPTGLSLKKGGKGEAVRDLFFRSRGIVDVNAAPSGELAIGSRNGSAFTLALTALLGEGAEALDGNSNGVVEWAEFFPLLQRQTTYNSSRMADGLLSHTPHAFTLPDTPAGSGEQRLPVRSPVRPNFQEAGQ